MLMLLLLLQLTPNERPPRKHTQHQCRLLGRDASSPILRLPCSTHAHTRIPSVSLSVSVGVYVCLIHLSIIHSHAGTRMRTLHSPHPATQGSPITRNATHTNTITHPTTTRLDCTWRDKNQQGVVY